MLAEAALSDRTRTTRTTEIRDEDIEVALRLLPDTDLAYTVDEEEGRPVLLVNEWPDVVVNELHQAALELADRAKRIRARHAR